MNKLSIVIVNYKMSEHVRRCLDTLKLEIDDLPGNVKVMVVDNASADGLGDLIKTVYPWADFIGLPANVGFSRAQNVGLKANPAEYYLILNPDTVFLPGQKTLRRWLDFMDSHPKIGLTGPKILNPNLTLQYSCYRFPSFWQPLFSRTKLGEGKLGKKMNANFLMLDFDHEETQPVDWVMGSAMMIRQAAAAAVGFFDEMFWMYAEDSDLCRRLWEKGYPVYYLHDVVVVHEHRRGSARVPGVLRAVIKNRLTREHLKSWFKYNWKWRGNKKYYERIP